MVPITYHYIYYNPFAELNLTVGPVAKYWGEILGNFQSIAFHGAYIGLLLGYFHVISEIIGFGVNWPIVQAYFDKIENYMSIY